MKWWGAQKSMVLSTSRIVIGKVGRRHGRRRGKRVAIALSQDLGHRFGYLFWGGSNQSSEEFFGSSLGYFVPPLEDV